ncbi:MAG: hypothetical protein ACTHJL_07645 [Amnibacterium sp.]
MTPRPRTAGRRGAAPALLGGATVLLLSACSLGSPTTTPTPPGTTTSAAAPTPSATVPVVAGDSPRAAALAYRTAVAAALGHRLTYLEYLCSVPSGRDAATVFVAVHERTSWDSGRSTLDAVLAQPVRPVAPGAYRPGPAVPLRSVRDGRLGGDAIIGLVGSDHRCSASYIGAPATG